MSGAKVSQGEWTFPGLYCPGLIEAAWTWRSIVAWMSVFPGLYCPGLIEAGVHWQSPPLAEAFPGLYCPGLIEADRTPRRVRLLHRHVSGALLPRPH